MARRPLRPWWRGSTVHLRGRIGLPGGISKNFSGNLVLGEGDRLAVEADEFDRSFLRLSPDVAVVTSCDPDHLDIYGTYEAVKEAFGQFIERIKAGGALILKRGRARLRQPRNYPLSLCL